MKSEIDPMGLYIHVPFCLSKCDYCAFYSITPDQSLVDNYLIHLEADLQEKMGQNRRSVNTIFVGGGNPTCLGVKGIEKLVRIVEKYVDSGSCQEWTFETNPETVTSELVDLLAGLPSIRISMGIQRLQDHELQILGRRSSSKVIYEALEILAPAISNLGIDLIMGVPGCGFVSDSLGQLIKKYSIKHVSAYFLTIEPGTPLYRKVEEQRLSDPTEIGPDELFCLRDCLALEGFEHYEISNYSRPDWRCQHNLNYWLPADYIGVGPSAVSSIGTHRYTNVSDIEKWLAAASPEHEVLSYTDRQNEFVMLRLRLLKDGLNLKELVEKFGAPPANFYRNVKKLLNGGRLYVNGPDSVAMTDKGLIMADDLMASLFI